MLLAPQNPEGSFNPSEVASSLDSLATSMESKFEQKTEKVSTRHVKNWFSLVEVHGKELFENPSKESFGNLNAHLSSEWVPQLVLSAVEDEQVPVEQALHEAFAVGFISRHELMLKFLENPKLTKEDADHILMSHFLQTQIEFSSRVFGYLNDSEQKEMYAVTNGMLGGLVAHGLVNYEGFEKVIAQEKEVRKLQSEKFKEHTEYFKDAISLMARSPSRRNQEAYIRKVPELLKHYEIISRAISTGTRGEILSIHIVEGWIKGMLEQGDIAGSFEVGRTSEAADNGGLGDFCIHTPERDVRAVIEVKTENRPELGSQISYPGEEGIESLGDTDFIREPPQQVLEVVTKYARPVISLRIPSKIAVSPLTQEQIQQYSAIPKDGIIGADKVFEVKGS